MLIGASTGGPAHIEKILSNLHFPLPFSIIIAQHMGAEFLPSFVQQLAFKTKHSIHLCEDGLVLKKGNVYIATNYCSLSLEASDIKFKVQEVQNIHFNPDINHLFSSGVAFCFTNTLLAIILTGIGEDGVIGATKLAQNGVECIAESEESSIVYGMPARAKESVANIQVLHLDQIIDAIDSFGKR